MVLGRLKAAPTYIGPPEGGPYVPALTGLLERALQLVRDVVAAGRDR